MSIIPACLLKYNIGLDVGDNITNVLFEKNTLIPNHRKISFVVPELDEEYNINVIIGDNILASDNIILETINLKNIEKVLYLELFLYNYYIVININTKATNIYNNVITMNINYHNIKYFNKIIDIDNYNLKFDITQTIRLIRKKINLELLVFDDETKLILEDKLNKIIEAINNNIMSNQKMLDIKNHLKIKFFID
jgi:molecular chaperone DnaK (HSP70)